MSINNALKHALLSSFEQYNRQLQGKRIWLACSGGRDSLSLAYLCKQLFNAGQLPFLPQLLHVNHGMQAANTAWAQQVSTWAEQNQIPCQVLQISLGQSSEQAARQARYQAMISIMNQDDVLLLGHHQDDQVETLLMRLFNGAGVNGLSAIKSWSTKQSTAVEGHDQKSVFLWRPLLTVSRQQITEYANSHQLDYIDDPTNVAIQHGDNDWEAAELNDRAWMRSVLLPHITQRYPKAKQAIARTSQLMQEASVIIEEQSSADLSQLLVADQEWCSVLEVKSLNELSSARKSALIHCWLAPTAAELPPSKRLVEEVLALVQREDPDHQTKLYYDNGVYQYQIRRYQHKLYRLTECYAQWLQLAPKKHLIQGPLNTSVQNTNPVPSINSLSLKQAGTKFDWQLIGLSKLMSVLHAQLGLLTGAQQYSLDKTPLQLLFEPLPRELKLALAGRAGRKSGKKLLQALDQPSFKRQSVVLCSLGLAHQTQPLPLLLITLDKLVVLQSEFAQVIEPLIQQRLLVTRLQPA